jgi:hypothetical protein
MVTLSRRRVWLLIAVRAKLDMFVSDSMLTSACPRDFLARLLSDVFLIHRRKVRLELVHAGRRKVCGTPM